MTSKQKVFRFWIVVVPTMALFLAFLGAAYDDATAAPAPDLKVAVVLPLSGALSRNGNLKLQGIKAAMNWVNDNGGIKSLGGAKLVPVIADSGSSVEGAASAMERTARDPEIVMSMGAWASAFTLAATEVTERMGIPHFSVGLADQLSNRGYKWGFYVSSPSSDLTKQGLPKFIELLKTAGSPIKTAMYVGDNSASNKDFLTAAKKVLSEIGINLVGEESWPIGTLTDATPVMQKVKNIKPDVVLFGAIAIAEAQMCLMKKKEFGIKIPFVAFGGYAADPSFRKIGAENVEGLVAITPCFPHKLTPEEWVNRSIEQCKKEYSSEPFAGQDLTWAWTLVPIMAEVLERAGSRNREDIRNAASKIDINNIMATKHIPSQGIAFEPGGRISEKYRGVLLVQWQSGVPRAIYPSTLALSKPLW